MATFTFGHISLLSKSSNSTTRLRYPLSNPTLTIGRHTTCDCRIVVETCSKLHAVITVEEEDPWLATIEVKGVNGLKVNQVDYLKGDQIVLGENDIVEICERRFRWEGAKYENAVTIDSPEPVQRTKPRQSLLELAYQVIRTPSKAPSVTQQQTEQDTEEEGDLITWDEVEPVQDQNEVPATPDLAHRARTTNVPSSTSKLPSTPTDNSNGNGNGNRRSSLRMTIIPASRQVDFLREREEYLASLAPPPAPVLEPIIMTPTRKERRVSSTSRRISELLLLGSPVLVPASADDEVEEVSSEEESEEESEDENGQVDEEEEYEIPIALAPAPIEFATAAATESQEEQYADAEPSVLQQAISVPLLASPSPSPSPQSTPSSGSGSRRNSRRHSLREKVLIRSAIRESVSSQQLHTLASLGQAEEVAVEAEGDVEEVQDGEEEKAEEESPIPIPILSPRTPSHHRDSIELTHLRSISPSKNIGRLQRESDSDSEEEEEEEEEEEISMGSPTPAMRTPVATPSKARLAMAVNVPLPETPVAVQMTPVKVNPASVPLPQTPVGEWAYTPRQPLVINATFATPPPLSTPRMLGEEEDDGFRSEMNSPVTHHRIMATPKSVLRSAKTGRRKSIRGFLGPPPSTVKRRVAFNQQVFVQEIVDIRDKRCYYEEEKRRNSLDPAMVPLPDSPMPGTEAGTPARKAGRVPTNTPSSTVRKAIQEAQEMLSPVKMGSARRVPAIGGGGAAGATPMKVSGFVATPLKAGRVPVAGPNPANLITASTKASRQAEIRQLLEASPIASGSTFRIPQSASAPSNLARLEAKMEAIRRRSLAGSMSKPKFGSTPIARRNLVPATPTPAPATPTPMLVKRTPAPAPPPVEKAAPVPAPATDEGFSTPILKFRPVTQPRALPTPNLAAGFKSLFSSTAAPPKTPAFGGMRSLFRTEAQEVQTPKMDGLKEMMEMPDSPSPALGADVFPQVAEEVTVAPVVVEETLFVEPVATPNVEEAVEVSQGNETVEEPIAEVHAPGEEMVEEIAEPEVQVIEEPVIEAPIVEASVVETPIVEAPIVEAPVAEPPIVEAPVAEAPIVEASHAKVPEPGVEEEEPAVEVPAKGTTTAKAPAKPKRGTRTKVADGTAVEEAELVEELEEVVIPKRRAAAKPAVKAVPAAGRGRRAAPKVEPEVVENAEPEVDAAPKKATRGRKPKEAAPEPVAEPEAEAPQVEIPVKKAPARRGRAKAEDIPEAVPAPAKKAAASRKRATKTLEFHEDPVDAAEVVASEEASTSILQESTSSLDEVEIVKPVAKGRATKAKVTAVEKENAPTRGKRAAAAKAMVEIEAVAAPARSLRARR